MTAAAPRKVVIVNTSDSGGGAEAVSRALLDGFEELGTETRMAVATKLTDDPRVFTFYESPHVDYTPEHKVRRIRLAMRRKLDPWLGLEDFNHPYTRHIADLTGDRPDVLLCNNLHGGFFDLRQLPRLSRQMPIVLRLADGWCFTGHCAVPGGCERWRTGCGRCPDLAAPPAIRRDATRFNWQRKRRIFARSQISVAAPSRWLMERVQQSILAPAIGDARVIPNGVDLDTFTPDGPAASRPGDGAMRLVFAANGGAANPHKDFGTLRAALPRLDGPVELVAVGGDERIEDLGAGIRIRHEPPQAPDRLAALYRSADLYVHASPEESFCLAAAEALSCGVPVVAAAKGGIGEVVEDGRTGTLVDPGHPEELAASVTRLLVDDKLRERMGQAALSSRHRFDQARMVRDMHALCADAVEAWDQ